MCNIDPLIINNTDHPVHPGDLVRLTGLEWIGYYMMGKMGIVLDVTRDRSARCNFCHVLFDSKIVKIRDDDLTIISRAHIDGCGTI